jgi:hypothetical protein
MVLEVTGRLHIQIFLLSKKIRQAEMMFWCLLYFFSLVNLLVCIPLRNSYKYLTRCTGVTKRNPYGVELPETFAIGKVWLDSNAKCQKRRLVYS